MLIVLYSLQTISWPSDPFMIGQTESVNEVPLAQGYYERVSHTCTHTHTHTHTHKLMMTGFILTNNMLCDSFNLKPRDFLQSFPSSSSTDYLSLSQ